MMKARCPKCGRKLKFREDDIGRRGRCSSCRQLLAILQNGMLACLEMGPADRTVIMDSRAIVNGEPLPTHSPRTPSPRKFKLGDHIGLYQPWVLLLVFGGLIAVLLTVALKWPPGQPLDTPTAGPTPPAVSVTASPPSPEAPSSQPMTPPAARPSPSSSPPPAKRN